MKRVLLLALTHLAFGAGGFALGIYVLPILVAPPSPTAPELETARKGAAFHGQFRRDLAGSDMLHWGEGTVSVGRGAVSLRGRIAPGPAYKLYFSPGFVADGAAFQRLRPRMVQVGDVRTFENFIVAVPPGVDPAKYDTVVIWCEAFSQFITAAKYR